MKLIMIIRTTALILALTTVFTTTAAALSCGCGDICVNETGWWRDGGMLNASDTPIQFAIDNATAGDSIYVYNGSYTENMDVDKRLTLEGEGGDVVTVTAGVNTDHIFEVTANTDYVNISGFNVTGALGTNSAGIYLGNNVDHCNISDNIATNNFYGIYLDSSSSNTLTNNTANSNTFHGIYLYTLCNNNTLTSNSVDSNTGFGIFLQTYSSNNTLTNNTANENSYYGILLMYFSSNNTLTSNNVSDNNYDGIRLWRSSNNTLTNNTANSNGWDGIYLYSSSNNNVTCNWVYNNTDAGFYLTSGSTGNTIESNNIIANGVYNTSSDGYEWQFYNDQSDDVNTAGNWWGTNNTTRINASIYDWTYDAGWGNVTTTPKLDGAVPCAPIPEAATVVLLAVGLLMLAGYVRVGRRKM